MLSVGGCLSFLTNHNKSLMKNYKVVARINGQLESAICGKHYFRGLRTVIYKRGKPSVPHPKDGALAYFKTRKAAESFLDTEQTHNNHKGLDIPLELWTCDVIDWPEQYGYWQEGIAGFGLGASYNGGCASSITLRGKCKIALKPA